jgi:hypothetical protein
VDVPANREIGLCWGIGTTAPRSSAFCECAYCVAFQFFRASFLFQVDEFSIKTHGEKIPSMNQKLERLLVWLSTIKYFQH